MRKHLDLGDIIKEVDADRSEQTMWRSEKLLSDIYTTSNNCRHEK